MKDAQFKLDGQSHTLTKNEGNNHLHIGRKGFNCVIWDAEVFEKENEAGVQFMYLSSDGEEGYPGNITLYKKGAGKKKILSAVVCWLLLSSIRKRVCSNVVASNEKLWKSVLT
ncbi:hypothetical protein [Oceanobacillus sp. FSL W7-1293]|uniref:aldose epimerase family protein n=1 Tax=Oceanobacillus sp. FSL W7-1293 TaxID=2921699 RepID=UPI0030D21CAC